MPGRVSTSSTQIDPYKYTGHERDEEEGLNLDYMLARGYDPAIGRFLQIDPLANQFAEWSPYNYTYNNPISYTDPTGEGPFPSMAARHIGALKGIWNQTVSTVKGVAHAVTHPVQTAKNLYNAVSNPKETINAVSETLAEKKDQLVNGTPSEQGEVIGEGIVLAAELIVGTKGASKMKALSRGVDASDVTKINSVDDIASNTDLLVGKTVDEIGEALGEGWTKGVYGSDGTGWKFTHPDNGQSIFFHPGNGRHGGSYYGYSSGTHGKNKIVGSDYQATPDDKANIIKLNEN